MLTVRRLDIADARSILAGAARHAEEIGVPMCSAVVDEAGVLIAFERLDGGKVSSVGIAIDKAFTAGAARNTTAFYGDESRPGSPGWRIQGTNGGRFSTIAGGVPVVVDGQVVGGIGVSSGTADQDVEVAEAALAHFLREAGITPEA
ncbi:MAG: heme-binding protein [Streptosporangiales bacterium]|nr:heme-binding protein [Streptosporangiales bacterium]MBO0889302.1 heme-binding protein [Acidothermales bacterium]